MNQQTDSAETCGHRCTPAWLVMFLRARGLPTSRKELFDEFERQAERPLPSTLYEFAELKRATVGVDDHVAFDHRFYSMPHRVIKQQLDLRAIASTVEVLRPPCFSGA